MTRETHEYSLMITTGFSRHPIFLSYCHCYMGASNIKIWFDMISSLECFLRIVYFEQICLVLNSKSINQYTNVVQSQVICHVFMTVIAAGGTTWTRCLGHTPVRISVGSPIWRHCLASTAHWTETYGYIPALSWDNQWAGRWEHFFFFFSIQKHPYLS